MNPSKTAQNPSDGESTASTVCKKWIAIAVPFHSPDDPITRQPAARDVAKFLPEELQ
jgi:hypothetical protein